MSLSLSVRYQRFHCSSELFYDVDLLVIINVHGTQVAAVSGDARRALDICRRATELAAAEELLSPGPSSSSSSGRRSGPGRIGAGRVGTAHINRAVQEMFSSPKIAAIQ